jgi:hypothetical protein
MKSLSFAVSAVAIVAPLAMTPATAQQRAMGPPASADTFANAAGTSSRMALEQHACSVVMELHQPGDLYDTCVRSLNKTLSELDRARLVATDRRACAQQGLEPGTRAFAVCVVNTEPSRENAVR